MQTTLSSYMCTVHDSGVWVPLHSEDRRKIITSGGAGRLLTATADRHRTRRHTRRLRPGVHADWSPDTTADSGFTSFPLRRPGHRGCAARLACGCVPGRSSRSVVGPKGWLADLTRRSGRGSSDHPGQADAVDREDQSAAHRRASTVAARASKTTRDILKRKAEEEKAFHFSRSFSFLAHSARCGWRLSRAPKGRSASAPGGGGEFQAASRRCAARDLSTRCARREVWRRSAW